MNVLICGAGIAGLTLAFWLLRGGHTVTVVEKSPSLRDEGYMMDFFGSGYDVAEKMDLLAELEQIHYLIPRFAFLNSKGSEKFSVSYGAFRGLWGGRHFNFMRGDLERVLYSRVKDEIRLQFGTTIRSFRQCEEADCVDVIFSDGTAGRFDLMVGADGVNSHVRRYAFGDQDRFTRFLGYHTAAFILAERPKAVRSDSLYTLTVPRRQVGVYPISGGRVATFFIHKVRQPVRDFSFESAVGELRAVYGGLDWIVPELLDRCDRSSMYFDDVTQIELPRWRKGRVVLVGDACQCVSLLAGQGASMAMGGAYVLAEELARVEDDLPGALRRYENRVKPAIEKKQRAGRRIAGWFVPDNRARLVMNDLLTKMVEWPMAWRMLESFLLLTVSYECASRLMRCHESLRPLRIVVGLEKPFEIVRNDVGAVGAKFAAQPGEERHHGITLILRQAAWHAFGDPRGPHRFAGHGVFVLPRGVQPRAAEQQNLPTARHRGDRFALDPGRFTHVGDVLGVVRRGLRDRSGPQPVHTGQLRLVLRPEDPAPMLHDGAVAAGKDAHRSAVRGHVVEPEPQLGAHPAGGRLEVFPGGLDVHVASLLPPVGVVSVGLSVRRPLVRRKGAPPQVDGVCAKQLLRHLLEVRVLDEIDEVGIFVGRTGAIGP